MSLLHYWESGFSFADCRSRNKGCIERRKGKHKVHGRVEYPSAHFNESLLGDLRISVGIGGGLPVVLMEVGLEAVRPSSIRNGESMPVFKLVGIGFFRVETHSGRR